jgi:hypothetical protein
MYDEFWIQQFKVCKSVHRHTIKINQPDAGRPDHDQQHCYHHAPAVKPEAATAVVELPMIGVRTPETCWTVHKYQVIKLRDCSVWLVDLFELNSATLESFIWATNITCNFTEITRERDQNSIQILFRYPYIFFMHISLLFPDISYYKPEILFTQPFHWQVRATVVRSL